MDAISYNIKPIFISKVAWVTFFTSVMIVLGTFHSVFSFAAFAMSLIATVALSSDDSLCFLFFLMPLASIFKRAAGAQSFFTYLLLFYALFRLIKNHYINKEFFISLLCLVLFLVVQMFASTNILRVIKFITNLLLVYIAVDLGVIKNNKKIYLYYILGFAFSSLIAALQIIPNLNDYISVKSIGNQYEQFIRFTGTYSDPNYYSINVIVSLCLLVVLNHTKQLNTLPFVCLSGLMVLFAGLTLSKSAILMLSLPVALFLYSKIKKRNYLLFICCSFVIAIYLMALFLGRVELFNGIRYRFTNIKDISSFTTGRYDIWKDYLAFLSDNLNVLLFGGGFGIGYLNNHAAHNTYIDLLYYLGVVGTILLITTLCLIVNFKKTSSKLNLLNYSIWFCIVTMYFFLSELFYYDWSFHIIIAILVLKMNMSETHKEEF